jgi:phosphoserine phosphatase RsbU/P
VEARDAAGTLLGFERTLALSGETAAAIAAEARRFGQEDDITVVTVVRRRGLRDQGLGEQAATA